MFEPMLDARIVAHRRKELLRQARLHQLSREALGDRQSLYQRWLTLLADVLISGGTRLKHRYEDARSRRAAPLEPVSLMDAGWDRL